MNIIEITELFNIKCNKTHDNCLKINELLIPLIGNDFIPLLTIEFVDNYIGYMNSNKIRKCLQTDKTQECILLMIKYVCPSINSLDYFVRYPYLFNIFKQLIEYNHQLPSDLIDHAIRWRKNKIVIILTKYKNIQLTQKNLENSIKLCDMQIIRNILARKIVPDKNTVEKAIEYFTLSVEHLMSVSNAVFDIMTLKIACSSRAYNIIKLLLDMGIQPTKECFNNLFLQSYVRHGRFVVGSKYLSFRKKDTRDDINKNILLLTNYGYEIDYDDILFATKRKIEIYNFKSLNIVLDNKFVDLCAETHFHPYGINNAKPSIEAFEKICNHPRINTIKTILKSNVGPNLKCLKNVCKTSKNSSIAKMIIDRGIKPDVNCLNIVIKRSRNKMLWLIFDEYVKSLGIELDHDVINDYGDILDNDLNNNIIEDLDHNNNNNHDIIDNNDQNGDDNDIIEDFDNMSDSSHDVPNKIKFRSKAKRYAQYKKYGKN